MAWGAEQGREEIEEAYARPLGRTCSMAPITSVSAALHHSTRRVVRILNRQTSLARASSGGAAVRAAASTLSTKADSNIDRPVEDVVVVGAGIAGERAFEHKQTGVLAGRGAATRCNLCAICLRWLCLWACVYSVTR